MATMDSILQAGVVSAPFQVLIDRFATFTLNEASLILGADKQVRKLQRTVERIGAMVGHVEQNGSDSISNEAWKVWLEDVEKLLYSADDLLDGIAIDLLKHKANRSPDSANQVRNMVISSFQLTVPRDINEITLQLVELAKEMDVLFMTELSRVGSLNPVSRCHYYNSSDRSTSLVDEKLLVGREKQRGEITNWLLSKDLNATNVSVMPVVGMGGLGKTTLTQVVYGDCSKLAPPKFDMRIWVSVSPDFDVVRITTSIIESTRGKRCKIGNLDQLQVLLRNLLQEKKFLLVLDDYWSERYGDWDVLSTPFRVGAEGSKIIVTTRSTVVAQIVGSLPPYFLDTLTDDNCWQVMKQRAFIARIPEQDPELEEIGKMIARKCKGLPLAAKTLGSMLCFKNEVAEWNHVLNSEIWELPMDKYDLIPALALSYHHLPAHLKKCFAYCSVFPTNYEFEMDKLVLLWLAEGLIRPVGKVRLEDIGAEYFKDLTFRSIFKFSYNVHSRQIYKMHDLIHTMAKLVSGSTRLFSDVNPLDEDYAFFSDSRRLLMHYHNAQPVKVKCFPWFRNLRSLKISRESIGTLEVPNDLFCMLEVLRVLDLSNLGLTELHDSIDHLKHLRYLDMSGNLMKMLPESITKLVGLQTLKLERCNQLKALPRDMKDMISLRHLHVNIKQLCNMPSELGKLVDLQYLEVFSVGITKGLGIEELKNMSCLRGSIHIKNLQNVPNGDKAKEARLFTKTYLDKLELEWDDPRSGNIEEGILAGLCPHQNLKELSITNYNGSRFPDWLSRSSCKISSIHLHSCQYYNILLPLRNLPCLKNLRIENMSDCSSIDLSFSGFPVLQSLTIEDMPNLTNWKEIGSFPCLRTLGIIDCPVLLELPSLTHLPVIQSLNLRQCPEIQSLPANGFPVSLKELVILDCCIIKTRCRAVEGEDWFKLRSITKLEIDYVEIHQQP